MPEEVRRQRDPKGLYAAEQTGVVRQMAGAGTPVDLPRAPHLVLPTARLSLEECVEAVLRLAEERA